MALKSPSQFSSIDQEDVVAASNALQLASYSCLDRELSRDQIYRRVVDAGALASSTMVRMVKLQRSTNRKAGFLRQELAKRDRKVEKLQRQLKEAHAQVKSLQDKVSDGELMAVAFEVERKSKEEEPQVSGNKDLVPEVVLGEDTADIVSSCDDSD